MSTSYGATPPGITGTHFGGSGIGVLGSLVPSEGESGAGYLYAGLSLPADAGKEVRGPITRWPSGTLTVYEDSSFSYSGDADYALYALYVDGVASPEDIGYGAGIGRLELVVGDVATLSGDVTLGAVAPAGELVSSSGTGATVAEIWSYTLSNGLTAEATLVAVHTMLSELHLIHGLTAGSPLSVTAASRAAGAVSQAVAEAAGTVTVTRQ